MAEWFPTYLVTGGLYAGQTPSGNLDGFMQELNPRVLGSILVGSVDYTYTPGDPATTPHSWTGSYGQNEEAFRAYGDIHKDEGDVYTNVQIFTIPNPPNAQFYKQELVVYGSVREITQPGIDPSTLEEFVIHAYDFSISRIYRREYATPTSIPVVTDEFFGGGAAYGQANMRYIAFGAPSDPGTIMKRFRFAVSYYEKDGVNYLCWCFYGLASNLVTTYYHYACVGIALPVLDTAFGAFKLDENDDPNIDPDPDPDDPGQDPPPGPGAREPEYDPIPIPGMPDLDATGIGFLTLYTPSKAILNLLADEIFSTNILDIIKNYFASIQELIAGLTILPFFVPSAGYAHHKIGLFQSSVAMPVVASQFIEIDCGSVFVKRYFNNFLDQSPNTKIMLWLPYIGYQQLDADEVMDNTLSIKYHCDVLSGACVAFVSIGAGGPGADVTRVIAQYSGNVITQVPVASQSFDSLVSNAINILTSGVGIAAGAAIGGVASGGMASAAQATAGASQVSSAVGAQVGLGMGGTAANMVMSMKPTYSRNGTPGSTAGYMSVQKPYLIKIVPRDAVAQNHIQLKGYPSNYGGTLGSLSGYCEVSEIHLTGSSASVEETTEIYSLLKGGVII